MKNNPAFVETDRHRQTRRPETVVGNEARPDATERIPYSRRIRYGIWTFDPVVGICSRQCLKYIPEVAMMSRRTVAADFRVDIGRDDCRVTGLLGAGLVGMIVYLIAAKEPDSRTAGQPQRPVLAQTS
jgi:hypothetical protein